MSCGDKLKNNCGKKGYSTCIYHESELPDWSAHKDSNCVVVQENIDELYDEVGKLINTLDFEGLESECENFVIENPEETNPFKILITSIVKKLEELSCEETNKDGFYKEDLDISKWNIDTSCFTDECNDSFRSLSSLLKKMAERLCDRCVKVDKISGNKVYETLPDIIIADAPNETINITIPVEFCSLLKIKVTEDTTLDINGGMFTFTDEKVELVFDGENIIEL